MVAQSILFPTFAPAGVDTGSWVLGTGDIWLLVLLDHVRAQRAALPPAMEQTSHFLDPICSLNFEYSQKYSQLSQDTRTRAGHSAQ